jgi:asparagine synthase (glutamine-hydrolysing)
MCGIAGFVGNGDSGQFAARVEAMTSALVHRGPDDEGAWVDAEAGVALGHRRLSIIDLSAQGHQPMESAGGRYVITFNGEIYNFQALRRELDDAASCALRWRGHSDTEVMLAAFEAWGVEGALQRLNGMFAFALWDRKERRLHFARDRMGEKPIYYGWSKGTFLFGSELKALRAHPAFDARIDRGAITLLLRHGCVPAPYSIYQGVKKLTPGTLATLTLPQIQRGEEPSLSRYWSLRDVAEQGIAQRATLGDAESVEQFDGLLRNAIAQQMVADVPLGAFLSGGVDSSTIVALMQAQSARPVKTFTIGFSEKEYNEAVHAKKVAHHLGTDHTELYVTSAEARAVIPTLSVLYDEPFSDSSQIPTFLIAQMARQHVTVALSGDAGDELFGGYNRYLLAGTIWRMIGWLSPGLRRMIAGGLTALSPDTLNRAHGAVSALLPRRLRVAQPGDKAHKLSEILAAGSAEAIYRDLVSHWKTPAEIVIGATEPPTVLTERAGWPALPDFEQRMMYLDAVSYLPDDILAKVDRAAMGASLETRVPFLDHRVVEFAWRLPLSMKIRNGQGKWILRQVLDKYVPKKLIERPKMGFGVPIDAWLRGPLREWAESLLDESRLSREGFFHPAQIRKKWREHLSGERNWQYYLWDVLMFQAWHEHWIGR